MRFHSYKIADNLFTVWDMHRRVAATLRTWNTRAKADEAAYQANRTGQIH